MQRPIIGVMGGSSATPAVTAAAMELGRLIARHGWILLNGGRNVGVMDASAEGAREAGGTVIGILPDKTKAKASRHLDFAILTGMGDARNVINVLSSDVIVACRGALGTMSEVVLGLHHGKRVILLDWELVDPPLRPHMKKGQLTTASTPQDAIDQVAIVLAETERDCQQRNKQSDLPARQQRGASEPRP